MREPTTQERILSAFGQAARRGGICCSGDGRISMTSDGWNRLPALLQTALATAIAEAEARGRRQGPAWQPISEAPHEDGWIKRCLFGKMQPWGWSSWVGQRDDYDMWLGVDEAGGCWDCEVPTHFQPLPDPPSLATAPAETQKPETGEITT